ncbi:hypothetical protein G6L97_04000 [Agrobacterium tumefaciens]|uniref:hypothetical protein n=1 Tax=Agrobacterium TaxID=357 RepID=UPI000DD03D0D|nr:MULTISPECIES: hypothetical protein [Agrobacterium]NSY42722.1 hypothetical protein [Agrobacterium tumefaciens]NSZ83575.1 hypothetical protein [Agrobacterium tumefaciens]WCA69783.1 hypothetical protein G6L97_04000 [Agrobacterium tumefaciens]
MSESCPVLTPAEQQVQDILERTEAAMMATIHAALERASKQAAEELQAVGSEIQPPPHDYFAAVAHQQLFLLLCGANPDTFEGGDPEIAGHIIRNAQNISDHYWQKKNAAADVSGN